MRIFYLLAFSFTACIIQLPRSMYALASNKGSIAGSPGKPTINDLQNALNNLTEDDINSMLDQLSKMSPQELEELERIGRAALNDMGIDPDTLQPTTNMPPLPSMPSFPSPLPALPPQPPVPPKKLSRQPDQIGIAIQSCIKLLESLRSKFIRYDAVKDALLPVASYVETALYYFKMLNDREHFSRIARQDYDILSQKIIDFESILQTYEPAVEVVPSINPIAEENPYITLGITPESSQVDIDAALKEKKKLYNEKAIRKQLQSINASAKEIERATQAARLSLELTLEAYNLLSNPLLREQIDQEILHKQQPHLSPAAPNAIAKITNALQQLTEQQNLLPRITLYLKEHEPEKLKVAQDILEQEKKRIMEQQDRSRMQPIKAMGTYDPRYQQSADRTPMPSKRIASNPYTSGTPRLPLSTAQSNNLMQTGNISALNQDMPKASVQKMAATEKKGEPVSKSTNESGSTPKKSTSDGKQKSYRDIVNDKLGNITSNLSLAQDVLKNNFKGKLSWELFAEESEQRIKMLQLETIAENLKEALDAARSLSQITKRRDSKLEATFTSLMTKNIAIIYELSNLAQNISNAPAQASRAKALVKDIAQYFKAICTLLTNLTLDEIIAIYSPGLQQFIEKKPN